MIRKILLGATATAALLIAAPAAAHASADWGQIPGPAGADCEVHWVDPAFPVVVTAESITIDGLSFPAESVNYDFDELHRANFPWTEAQLAAFASHLGPDKGEIAYSWNLTGPETPPLVVPFELDCGPQPCEFDPQIPADDPACIPPVVGPPAEPIVPAVPATTPPTTQDLDHPEPECTGPDTNGDGIPDCLPFTGSSTARTLTLGGLGIVALGAAALGFARRRRVAA